MSLTVSKKSKGEQEFTVLGEMGEIYDETEASGPGSLSPRGTRPQVEPRGWCWMVQLRQPSDAVRIHGDYPIKPKPTVSARTRRRPGPI